MGVHIYTQPMQPFTRYKVLVYGPRYPRNSKGQFRKKGPRFFIIKNNPRRLARCWRCRRMRRAENLAIQVYYDIHPVWCRDRDECKQEASMLPKDWRRRPNKWGWEGLVD